MVYACKLGQTICLVSRNNTYSTGEIVGGYYEVAFKFNNDRDHILAEYLLGKEFKNLGLHISTAKGKEFYKRDIINLIEKVENH
jgi:hypothetical protein